MTTSEPLPPLLIDARTACRMLGGISEKTLFNWRMERGLPSVKIGNGRRLYSPTAMAEWISKQDDNK